jgi:undecaprenyl diphosphate synthase
MSKTLKLSNSKTLPVHIAIIVDGNRRWAKKHGLPIVAGHRKATEETIEKLIFHAMKLGVKYLTFWAFSTENWKRGQRFSSMLFGILENKMNKGVEKYNQAGIRLRIIGDLSKLPPRLVTKLQQWEKDSQTNHKITVIIALNYGGRDEILRAVNKFTSYKQESRFDPGSKDSTILDRERLEQYLDTAGIPDPDLIIRTGGEQRLSGFLMWQSQYAELYFTKVFFPDFTPLELDKAIEDFQQRQRRFGK